MTIPVLPIGAKVPSPVRKTGPILDGPGPVVDVSDALEDRGDALAAADAHRDQRVPAAGPAQLVEGLDDQDGAGGAERVTQGDTASVRIGPFRRQAPSGWQPCCPA